MIGDALYANWVTSPLSRSWQALICSRPPAILKTLNLIGLLAICNLDIVISILLITNENILREGMFNFPKKMGVYRITHHTIKLHMLYITKYLRVLLFIAGYSKYGAEYNLSERVTCPN